MSSCQLILTLLMATSWMAVLAAVGPVMNQQPSTVFELIQNDPDLSEVNDLIIRLNYDKFQIGFRSDDEGLLVG